MYLNKANFLLYVHAIALADLIATFYHSFSEFEVVDFSLRESILTLDFLEREDRLFGGCSIELKKTNIQCSGYGER